MNRLFSFVLAFLSGIAIIPNHALGQQGQTGQKEVSTSFPVFYSLRDSTVLSPVRSQPTGGCWASSALITLETAWRRAGAGDFSLSDKNLQLFHGFSDKRNTNGNHYMATAYFSRWSGPVIRSEETDSIKASPDDLPFHITEARYLSSDSKIIKETLMDFGPVYSMMYFSRKTCLDTLSNIHYSTNEKINHAVVLIGWNDTLNTKIGEGAWIAQNSLGLKFADSGFFYIPYQDKNILQYNAIWPKWETTNVNAKLCYYDTLGSYESYGFGDSICYGLVKFTVGNSGKLIKVASFINNPNTTIAMEVYGKFDKETHELSEKLGYAPIQKFSDAGYYTMELNQKINLSAEQDFYVMARYCTPGDTLPLPVESFIPNYSDPHIQSGKCWINPDFEKWPTIWYECGKNSEYPYLQFDLNIRALLETEE